MTNSSNAVATSPCGKCAGTGTYEWITPAGIKKGVCYGCKGKGQQDRGDERRNYGHAMHNVTTMAQRAAVNPQRPVGLNHLAQSKVHMSHVAASITEALKTVKGKAAKAALREALCDLQLSYGEVNAAGTLLRNPIKRGSAS